MTNPTMSSGTATHLLLAQASPRVRRCIVVVVVGHMNTVEDAGDVWVIVFPIMMISPMTKKNCSLV